MTLIYESKAYGPSVGVPEEVYRAYGPTHPDIIEINVNLKLSSTKGQRETRSVTISWLLKFMFVSTESHLDYDQLIICYFL